jgi:hypothetical protein
MTATSSRHLALFGLMTALFVAGCATAPSGAIAGVKVPEDATVALFSTPNYPYDDFDTDGVFLDFLRKCGLSPMSKADATFTVQIGFKRTDPSSVTCSLVLLHAGQAVISASGVSSPPPKVDPDAPLTGSEKAAAERISAFRAAARNFEAKARGAS